MIWDPYDKKTRLIRQNGQNLTTKSHMNLDLGPKNSGKWYKAVFESRLAYGIMFHGSRKIAIKIFVTQKRAMKAILQMRIEDSSRRKFRY